VRANSSRIARSARSITAWMLHTPSVDHAGALPPNRVQRPRIGVVAWMICNLINTIGYAKSTSWTQNGIDHFRLGDFSELLRTLINYASPTPKVILLKLLTGPSRFNC